MQDSIFARFNNSKIYLPKAYLESWSTFLSYMISIELGLDRRTGRSVVVDLEIGAWSSRFDPRSGLFLSRFAEVLLNRAQNRVMTKSLASNSSV